MKYLVSTPQGMIDDQPIWFWQKGNQISIDPKLGWIENDISDLLMTVLEIR